jgi:2-polyprenyl-3-methyl-5-hydroxy-6-metoxy-1,4-benzoquinol methylase/transcription elongation factor Elf1
VYSRVVTSVPVRDATGGFNLITTKFLTDELLEQLVFSGYAYQMQLKYLLWKNGARITEVPILFKNRREGESKISNHIIAEGILAPWKMVFKNYRYSNQPNLFKNKKSKESNQDNNVHHTNINNSEQIKSIECPVCHSQKISFFTEKNTYKLYSCNSCKLLFLYPLPTTLDTVYDASYFSGAEGGFGYTDYDADKEPMIPVFGKYLDIIETYIPRISKNSTNDPDKERKLLDVGAATGFFMAMAEKRGWKTIGVEFSDFAVQQGKKKGLDLYTGDIHLQALQPESFDVITLFDVVEHMLYPEKDLARAYELLKPGGIIVVNTPNAQSLFAKTMGKRWHLIVPPEHVHYFSPENLSVLVERVGFSVKEIKTIGKKFTPQYILKTLYKWSHFSVFNKAADMSQKSFLRNVAVPINLHDNFFLIAQKHDLSSTNKKSI